MVLDDVDGEQVKGRRRRAPMPPEGLEAELDPFLASEGKEGGRDDLFDGEW
jgi:hypothetical protein